jgi:ribosomal-protein-alanine N-acetyltransferase
MTAELWPIELEGSNIRLREFALEDVDAVAAIIGDDRVTRFLSFDSRTREQAADMVTGTIKRATEQPRTEFYLAITPREADDVVGFARLALGAHRGAKLGYAVGYEHQGKGHASEAVALMLDFGFGALGLHRITAAIGPDNPSSHAIAQRLGFTREGVLRDHVFTNGAWRDSVLYSLLAPEWTTPGSSSA